MRLRLGAWSWLGSFMSSTCVQCAPAWSSLNIPLQTELVINIRVTVSDTHQNVLEIREDVGGPNPVVSDACFPASPTKY